MRSRLIVTWLCTMSMAGAAPTAAADPPFVVISLLGSTLRLEQGSPAERRVFPVGVARQLFDGPNSATGVWFTGSNPDDPQDYVRARWEPRLYGGLPFLRLDRARREGDDNGDRAPAHPYGIHGPVTPSLVWGTVTAGCVRMRPSDLRLLFAVALRHPSMPITIIRELDVVEGRPVLPDPVGKEQRDCPEAVFGVRRVAELQPGSRMVHDRICAGVDHWYVLKLASSGLVAVHLRHSGALRVELYGPRAISTVRSAQHRFTYHMPRTARGAGVRYLRVVAPRQAATSLLPYSLTLASP